MHLLIRFVHWLRTFLLSDPREHYLRSASDIYDLERRMRDIDWYRARY